MKYLFFVIAFIAGHVHAQGLPVPEFSGVYSRTVVNEAKVCSKGKACGNTCISRDKTCHIGTSPYPPPVRNPVTPSPVLPPVVTAPQIPVIPDVAIKPAAVDCREATVLRVIDGDTLVVQAGTGVERVRIGQVDAPQASQPYGRFATSCLAAMVDQRAIRMCADGKDRYGRTVANIAVNGSDVGQRLVAQGCAWAYGKYLEAGSDLPSVQAQAQALSRGLWAGQATAPWDYRGGSAPVPVASTGNTPVTVTATTMAAPTDRILDWAESAFSEVLQSGTETLRIAQGGYRCYASSMCLGVLDGQTILYDGISLVDVGAQQIYLEQAASAGF